MVKKILVILILSLCIFQQFSIANAAVGMDLLNKDKYIVYEGTYTDIYENTIDILSDDYWVAVKQLETYDFDKNKILSREQHKQIDLESYKLCQYEKEFEKITSDNSDYYGLSEDFVKIYLFDKYFESDKVKAFLDGVSIAPLETPNSSIYYARRISKDEYNILYKNKKKMKKVLKEVEETISNIKLNNSFLKHVYFVTLELEDSLHTSYKSEAQIYNDIQAMYEQGYTTLEQSSITNTWKSTNLMIKFDDKLGSRAVDYISIKDDSLWKQVASNCYEALRERTSQHIAEMEAERAKHAI